MRSGDWGLCDSYTIHGDAICFFLNDELEGSDVCQILRWLIHYLI